MCFSELQGVSGDWEGSLAVESLPSIHKVPGSSPAPKQHTEAELWCPFSVETLPGSEM